jgi:hypothetical protein
MPDTVEGTLDYTMSSETANSYCNTEYAAAYWEQHYDSTKAAQWAALSMTQQQRLLVRACGVIEGLRFTIPITLPEYALHYDRHTGKVLDLSLTRQPVKFFYYQRLQFPRNLDVYYFTTPLEGQTYIRPELMDAQSEQAMYLLNFDDSVMANRLMGLTMEKVAVGKQAVDITQEYGTSGSSLSPVALDMVRQLLVKGGRMQRS